MQLKIDELKLDENSVEIRDSIESGSAIRTLLFGDTMSFDEEGVAMKITKDTVYLTVTGIDEANDDVIKCQWEMNRPELIKILMGIEGH